MKTFKEAIEISEAVGVSSKNLRNAMERVHDVQLEIQSVERKMVTAQGNFVALPKEDPKREKFKQEILKLNKSKAELQKKLQLAELDLERELRYEETDDVEIDLL